MFPLLFCAEAAGGGSGGHTLVPLPRGCTPPTAAQDQRDRRTSPRIARQPSWAAETQLGSQTQHLRPAKELRRDTGDSVGPPQGVTRHECMVSRMAEGGPGREPGRASRKPTPRNQRDAGRAFTELTVGRPATRVRWSQPRPLMGRDRAGLPLSGCLSR